MKKILLALMILALCVTVPTLAAEAVSVEDLSYEIRDGQVTITDCNEAAFGSLVIPAEIEGYPVTKIGDYAFYYCNLTAVTIPEGVTNLGQCAFQDCIYLRSVTIPESVTAIGNGAFWGCTKLTAVTIPEGITAIRDYTFYYCFALSTVDIPESVTYIGDYAFYECKVLRSVKVPERVTYLGEYVFHGAGSLTSVNIPEGIRFIGDFAFYNCRELTSVTIPEGVTAIGDKAFRLCGSLTEITIPANVAHMGYAAFADCTELKTVTFMADAPAISDISQPEDQPFAGCKATAYYYKDAKGWDSQTRLDFGSNLIWSAKERKFTTLTGSFTTAGEGPVTLKLTAVGAKTPAATLTSEEDTYTVSAVPGDYILTVTKDGCVSRTYEITLTEEATVLDVVLCSIGDVMGDGETNIVDVARLYAYVKCGSFGDAYAQLCADVTGDGNVDILDVAMLYAHVRGVSLLY